MSAEWEITTLCRWCGSRFTRIEIDHARAFVCETEACRERQIQWKITDIAGNLLYLPLPVQVEFAELLWSQKYGAICIGGHRASSKSIAIRMESYRACRKFKELTLVLLRRQLGELELNQGRFFEREAPRIGAEYSTKKIVFKETGSDLRFGHCKDPDDYKHYIGADVDGILLEQIELFLQRQVAELAASTGRNTKHEGWRGVLLATENPGGPLSSFVSDIFIKRSLDPIKYPNYKPENYAFLEATLEDNPYTDSRYEQNLALLPPARRAMMRHGDRTVFEGQFFQSFMKESHVTDDLGHGVKWFASLRFGFNQIGHALLWNVLASNHVCIHAEFRFEQMNEDALARQLNAWAQSHGLKRLPLTYAQPELFTNQDADRIVGQSIGETLQANDLPVIEADADELNGWKRVQAFLRPDPNGIPWLRIHPSCEDLINGLSNAMCADNDADLVADESPMLSALHALRYGAMSRPVPAKFSM